MKEHNCQNRPQNARAAGWIRLRGNAGMDRVMVSAVLTVATFAVVETTIAGDRPFTFGVPRNLGSVVNSTGNDAWPCIFADELYLIYSSDRSGGYGSYDLYMTTRPTRNDGWTTPINLGPNINSKAGEVGASISSDGLELYFSDYYMTSPRPGGFGEADIWVAKRSFLSDDFGPPENLGLAINSGSHDAFPSISADGLSLYFASMRDGTSDVWKALRASKRSAWQPAIKLNKVNDPSAQDGWPAISRDGLVLFFGSNRAGFGDYDIWMATRSRLLDDWGDPTNIGGEVNAAGLDLPASLGASELYFFAGRLGGFGGGDIYQASIIPFMDFSGDGAVDETDMAILVDNWGLNEPLCDIGPFAWGDGVVDEKDLAVLMKEITGAEFAKNPLPQAAEVPRDTILSWTAVPFAETYDVYFGTSFEAVDVADQANPRGVLVSMGQAAITYDPEGLLDYGQTYYWRVDFIGPGPAFTVYGGLVQEFTTEAYAYPVQNITATASGSQANMGPEKIVDGSGLDESDGHSTNGNDMWQSANVLPHWIQFEFDQVYTLHELWVWNSNQLIEPIVGFGAKSVKMEYSADGTTWTPLEGVPEFAQAPGTPGYTANTIVSFGGASAKYVKLTIAANWGGLAPQTGLSEVRFFYIPAVKS